MLDTAREQVCVAIMDSKGEMIWKDFEGFAFLSQGVAQTLID